jgi:hypothetical protein
MADRRRHPGWVVAFVAGVLASCGGGPTIMETPAGLISASLPPTAIASTSHVSAAPSPTASPSPVSTPAPSAPPPDSLPTSASNERDGVRITVGIGSNPLRAGERTVLQTTVKNTGRDMLRWSVDGCATDVLAQAELPGATWRPSTITTRPLLRAYSAWLAAEARLDLPLWLRFERASLSGMRDYGCADLAMPRSLKPGESTTQDLVWDGQIRDRLGPPPSGPTTITATFGHWYRGAQDQGDETHKPIVVKLDSWVIGDRPAAFLSPAEAIDSALVDPAFADWVITQPFNDRRDGLVEYDPDVDAWIVGLIHDRDGQRSLLHAALVDPLSGEVLAIREHEVR